MTDVSQRTAGIFNSCIGAFAISAAWELGILDHVASQDSLDIKIFAKENGLHPPSLSAVLETLVSLEILTVGPGAGSVSAGPLFEEVIATKGFFYWLTHGSIELFSEMSRLVHESERVGEFIHRDQRAIGLATRDLGDRFFDAPYFELLDEIEFSKVADLGCGSAERLIKTAITRPNASGVGVDLSLRALGLATEAVANAGVTDRVSLVQADARNLSPRIEFEDVDLVTSFLMGHDFWPREECVKSLHCMHEAFPNVKYFVLCDTYRSEKVPSRDLPMFTLGFEIGHALMGKYLPTLEEWCDVFADGGWKCIERRDISMPQSTSAFVLAPE